MDVVHEIGKRMEVMLLNGCDSSVLSVTPYVHYDSRISRLTARPQLTYKLPREGYTKTAASSAEMALLNRNIEGMSVDALAYNLCQKMVETLLDNDGQQVLDANFLGSLTPEGKEHLLDLIVKFSDGHAVRLDDIIEKALKGGYDNIKYVQRILPNRGSDLCLTYPNDVNNDRYINYLLSDKEYGASPIYGQPERKHPQMIALMVFREEHLVRRLTERGLEAMAEMASNIRATDSLKARYHREVSRRALLGNMEGLI